MEYNSLKIMKLFINDISE